MDKIDILQLSLENKDFWYGFFASGYLTGGHDEDEDISVVEIMEDLADIEWWDEFTGYYDGVLDDSDGYLDEPTTVETEISPDKLLSIEFHPGDILYYVNNEQIASLGPHYKLRVLPFDEIMSFSERQNGDIIFFLLLPIAKVDKSDAKKVIKIIEDRLTVLFDKSLCRQLSKCIVNQLITR